MDIEFGDALALGQANEWKRFPAKDDARAASGLVVPGSAPRFRIARPARVFTIGSCFARNIEEAMADLDVDLPTTRFAAPKEEWPHRPNGLLNEYNPGSIAQRIDRALGQGDEAALASTLYAVPGGVADLLLPGGAKVSLARAIERRAEIDAVYSQLPGAALLVITLGLTEAWFDRESGLYLNRMPPPDARRDRRFVLRPLDVEGSLALLEPAFERLIQRLPRLRILVTVSPVPLQATFLPVDACLANAVSKSTLRLVAQRLWDRFPEVDYFPSYELVVSGGTASYGPDNVHVKDAVVRTATRHMIDLYLDAPA